MSLLTHPAHAEQLNRISAWLLMGMSVLTLLWAVLQLGAALAMDFYDVRHWLSARNMLADGLLGWLITHFTGLSVALLLSCLPCLAVAAGMLKQRNWARQGFIALLLLSAALNLASLPLLDRLLLDLLSPVLLTASDNGGDFSQMYAELRDVRAMLWISSGLPLLALSAIHVWLARRFNQADMRQLFA
jgi:hypothetical protein